MVIINFPNKYKIIIIIIIIIIIKKKIGINSLSVEKKIGEKYWSGKRKSRKKFVGEILQKIYSRFPDFFSPIRYFDFGVW